MAVPSDKGESCVHVLGGAAGGSGPLPLEGACQQSEYLNSSKSAKVDGGFFHPAVAVAVTVAVAATEGGGSCRCIWATALVGGEGVHATATAAKTAAAVAHEIGRL